MQSWTPPTNEMIEKVLASVKKETDRQYFFSRLKNPLWLGPLRERGYFNSPPALKKMPDGHVQYPHWPELDYLVAIAEEVPDQVVEVILSLPKTDNPRVYDEILEITLKLEEKPSAALLPKLIEYIELENQSFALRFSELLTKWAENGNTTEAIKLAGLLIPFHEDPNSRTKQKLRRKKKNSLGSLLEPTPRFEEWAYQKILEKGVRSLAEHEPYQVSCILIEAVASMVMLRMHQEDVAKGSDQDYSEVWCRKLDKPDRDYQDAKETLVQTLTYACEQVYTKAPRFVAPLDHSLRKHRWKVFKRLRQYLYASHPNDQTLPWIREEILGHDGYSKWDYHYELQLMIRAASERFELGLLSDEEKKEIFDAILNGPSKDDFREWMGGQYSDESFQQRQRHFHRMQLRPFAAQLRGDIRKYFDELEDKASSEVITDDKYLPYSGITSGVVTYRSPKSTEDLESLSDDDLLTYLNDWNEEHRDKNDGLIEINISALASVFQSFFKDQILEDKNRLTFWLRNRDRVARPVYVAAMLKAMLELVKENNFEKMEQWLEFCKWVLSHPDTARVEKQPEPRDESREHPDWASSRRAVVDFISACVSSDTEAPITARERLADLLRESCGQFDWRLDQDHPVLLNHNDPITEAINNTRSRALESLVNFGFWIRRQLPEDQLLEVTEILSQRLAENAEIPLTRPEQALLGMHFGNLCTLNRDWATQHREKFFPKENGALWRDTFGSYIRFNRPIRETFEVLQGEFEYAIENLGFLTTEKGDGFELIDRLGQHLFTYYLWELYPLTGDESLLERFYQKTKDDRKRWGQLFNHVGQSLRSSGRELKKSLTDRIIYFFDWRFKVAEPLELQNFTFWLEAECLNLSWRLQSYSKILDLTKGEDIGISLEVRALNKLLSQHLSLAVECFAKITDKMNESTQMYILADEAKPILKAGLSSDDPQVRENSERARENLLQLGRFDYLDIE